MMTDPSEQTKANGILSGRLHDNGLDERFHVAIEGFSSGSPGVRVKIVFWPTPSGSSDAEIKLDLLFGQNFPGTSAWDSGVLDFVVANWPAEQVQPEVAKILAQYKEKTGRS